MNFENKANHLISRYPTIKRVVKRTYQITNYLMSRKIKSEGALTKITPNDEYEYFFGYYDKSPWDKTGRYVLCHRVASTWKSVAPKVSAEIILIDTHNSNNIKVMGKSYTWNIQQGSMLQWLGPDFLTRIIFNDYRNSEYCSIIKNINDDSEYVLSKPIYAVSKDGTFALTLDFSRLHRLRKGYGYWNLEDTTKEEKCPNSTCVWKIDLRTGYVKPLLSYSDLSNFEHREDMKNAEHKVNHLMINPTDDRVMFLHRWNNNGKKFTRLITMSVDGKDVFNLSDENMISHCYWKSKTEILAFGYKHDHGNGYYLMKDKSLDYKHLWPELTRDGHPSYSPDGRYVVTDTYPNSKRISEIYIIEGNKINLLARVFASFRYDNDFRCDLHPRWDYESKKICFDSVFEGKRGMYIVNIDSKMEKV